VKLFVVWDPSRNETFEENLDGPVEALTSNIAAMDFAQKCETEGGGIYAEGDTFTLHVQEIDAQTNARIGEAETFDVVMWLEPTFYVTSVEERAQTEADAFEAVIEKMKEG